MLINNAVITGSFIVNGVDVTGITGSSNVSSSYLALSASFLVTSASYAVTSASYASASGSLSIRTGNLEATSSTLVSASSSFAADSASLSTRLTTDETNFSNLSSSFATTSGSISSRVTLIEGQYATTGSNTFTGPQYASEASNAISFTSTASLYTDGGLRVGKSAFISGTAYFNDVVVYGTSSIEYITSSQVNIGSNIITVNTDTPAVRFGGLAVYDSGSTQLTGSMLWDSEANHWVYSNPSGSTYSGGMIMAGPRAASLGTEQGTTACALMMGQGGDHITSSAIFSYGNATCFYGTSLIVSSSGFTSINGPLSVGTSSVLYPLTINANSTQTSIGLMSGYSNAGARNWGIATNALAYGDLNIIQSSAQGEDPFSGCSRLYFSAAGAATFTCTVTACADLVLSAANPFLYGGTAAGGVGLSNIGGQTYIKVYGASHATAANNIAFVNASSTSLTILPTGNVGIGTASPSRLLDVNGFARFNSSSNYMEFTQNVLTSQNSDGAHIRSVISTAANPTYTFAGNTCTGIFQPSANTLAFSTIGSEWMRITSTGIACFAGNVCVPNLVMGFTCNMYIYKLNDTNYASFRSDGSGNIIFTNGTGGTPTARYTTTADGITCFACQICAPTLIAGTGGIRTSNNIIFPANLTTYTIWNEGYGGAIQLRRSDANTDRYSRIGIVDGSGNWVSGMTINGGTAWASFDAGVCAAQAVCSPTIYSTGNMRVSTATSAGNATDPAITTGGCTKVGIYFDGGCVAFGAGGNGLIFTQAGTVWGTAGNTVSNGVTTRSVGGVMAGTTAANWDFAAWDDSGTAQIFEIKAFFEHYYNWSYGASLYKYMATRETGAQDLTMFNCPTGNGGCWIAYKPNNTTLRVCKIAGSYPGTGAYWIQVIQKQP